MAEENKPAGQEGQPPAGGAPATPPPANSGPSVEELQKQNQKFQEEIKERDTKIADLENTRATIEARQRQVEEERQKQGTEETLKERISRINERRVYDPDGADSEMASLLGEVKTQAAKDAVGQAQGIITQQTIVEKFKTGIKKDNPDLNDELVDDVMAKANMLASTGGFKTAEEAIAAATKYVKGKLDSYAQKKNAAPPLPAGARAEGGGANQPPPPLEPEKEKTPLEEIEEANTAKNKRIL